MCNKRYTSKTKNKEIRSVSGKTDSPMSLLFCSRFSGWILYWRMDVIPRNPSYSASFSPIIFLLHNPFLISLYLGLNMYISKDDDYVPTFESRWIHRGSRYGYVPSNYSLPDHPHFRWVRQTRLGQRWEKSQCVKNPGTLHRQILETWSETQAEGSVSDQVLGEGIPLGNTSGLATGCER